MSKRASPARIGGFVVGAVTIAVVAVAIFGAGRLFRKVHPFVLYFEGDVSGLKVGAPVKFKGVEVGSVKSIMLNVSEFQEPSQAPGSSTIPVLIELDETRIRQKGGKVHLEDPETLERAIHTGMRAQLAMESFVTGLLYVKLDVFPGSSVKLVSDPTVKYPEIPTLPTPLEEMQALAQELLATLKKTNFDEMSQSFAHVAEGLDKLVNAPELKTALVAINTAIGSLTTTMNSIGALADNVNGNIAPLRASLQKTAENADSAVNQMRTTFETLNEAVQPDAPLMHELRTALENLSAAARNVRALADYLERNPSALLTGKAPPEGEQ